MPNFNPFAKPAPKFNPVEEYSRPGSAYVKRDFGGMPSFGAPPPPTRAGRPLAHGQATRKVRTPTKVVGMGPIRETTNEMSVMGTCVVPGSRGGKNPQVQNFNMMVIE